MRSKGKDWLKWPGPLQPSCRSEAALHRVARPACVGLALAFRAAGQPQRFLARS